MHLPAHALEYTHAVEGFLHEYVLPQWDSLNAYPVVQRASRTIELALTARGIKTHYPVTGHRAFLYRGRVTGGAAGNLISLVSEQAREAAASKSLTREYLRHAGVPTPSTTVFSSDDSAAALRFVRTTDAPMVLRPDAARNGRGVIFDISSESALKNALAPTDQTESTYNDAPTTFLLSEQLPALALRFYVVGYQVKAAVVRVPLFVVGDGVSTVAQLLQASYEHRSKNALLRRAQPETLPQYFASWASSLDHVPEDSEVLLLSRSVALAAGALPCDVTDEVSPELADMAVAAATSIPGFGAGAVDILTPSIAESDGAVVSDLHANLGILMHRNPAFGKRRLVASAIAEQIRLRSVHWEITARRSLPDESALLD